MICTHSKNSACKTTVLGRSSTCSCLAQSTAVACPRNVGWGQCWPKPVLSCQGYLGVEPRPSRRDSENSGCCWAGPRDLMLSLHLCHFMGLVCGRLRKHCSSLMWKRLGFDAVDCCRNVPTFRRMHGVTFLKAVLIVTTLRTSSRVLWPCASLTCCGRVRA
jgi:hypothetical protein